jgi:hypothetical protein
MLLSSGELIESIEEEVKETPEEPQKGEKRTWCPSDSL